MSIYGAFLRSVRRGINKGDWALIRKANDDYSIACESLPPLDEPKVIQSAAPPAVTEALEDLIVSVDAASECRQDTTATDAERRACTKDISASRSRLEELFREQLEEIKRLVRAQIKDDGEIRRYRARIASLKDSQITTEEATTLLDYLERPTSFDRNLILGTMAKLRSISSTPAPDETK